MRGSRDPALHLVNVWFTADCLCLAQRAVPDQAHEISVLPGLLTTVLAHWGIENGPHWILDVELGEAAACTRDRAAADLDYVPRLLNLM